MSPSARNFLLRWTAHDATATCWASALFEFPPVQRAVASEGIILATDITSFSLNCFVGDVFEGYQNDPLPAALSLIDHSPAVGRPLWTGGLIVHTRGLAEGEEGPSSIVIAVARLPGSETA